MAFMTIIQQQHWLTKFSVWDKSQKVVFDIVKIPVLEYLVPVMLTVPLYPGVDPLRSSDNMCFPGETRYGEMREPKTLP